MNVSFVVYGDAVPQGSKTVGRRKDGSAYVREANKNLKKWRIEVSEAARQAMGDKPLFTGPVFLNCVFFREHPVSYVRKDGSLRAKAPRFPVSRPDGLKTQRAVEDAMKGIVYKDDSQVVRWTGMKRYGAPARTIVEVLELGS